MSAEIPEDFLDLISGPVVVALTTVMSSGQPQSTPIWVDWDGTYVLVNTARGRVKDKNMQARARVTVLAIDPKDHYRWLEIRGQVEDATEEGAVEHIDKLSRRYDNKPYYSGKNEAIRRAQTRVIYRIRPTHVIAHCD